MAKLNLLGMVTEFCKRRSLPIPTTVVGATDDLTLQIWGLMNEGIQDVASRFNHYQLQTPLTFNHLGGTNYLAYLLSSIPDFKFIIPDTFWNATNRIRVNGPLSPVEWQALVTMLSSQALYSYMLAATPAGYAGPAGIYIFGVPSPLSGTTFSLMYQSLYGCATISGASEEAYSTDASTCRLPDALMIADLTWRFNMAKGLPYAEQQRISEEQLTNAVGGNTQGTLVMDQADFDSPITPGLLIPAGNWNVH